MIVRTLMGGCYRRIAGLVPVLLPEAVCVTDPAVLVAADHPLCRMHAVIKK